MFGWYWCCTSSTKINFRLLLQQNLYLKNSKNLILSRISKYLKGIQKTRKTICKIEIFINLSFLCKLFSPRHLYFQDIGGPTQFFSYQVKGAHSPICCFPICYCSLRYQSPSPLVSLSVLSGICKLSRSSKMKRKGIKIIHYGLSVFCFIDMSLKASKLETGRRVWHKMGH